MREREKHSEERRLPACSSRQLAANILGVFPNNEINLVAKRLAGQTAGRSGLGRRRGDRSPERSNPSGIFDVGLSQRQPW
jgi:hypothetical protein